MEVNQDNLANVPNSLLNLSYTGKPDVFRDYYLSGKEGNLSLQQKQDLTKRFGDDINDL